MSASSFPYTDICVLHILKRLSCSYETNISECLMPPMHRLMETAPTSISAGLSQYFELLTLSNYLFVVSIMRYAKHKLLEIFIWVMNK